MQVLSWLWCAFRGVLTRRCVDRNLNAWLYSGLSCLSIASVLPHYCLMPALSKVSKLSNDPICWPWWIRLMTLMDSHRNRCVHMHWWPWWIHTDDPWIRSDTLDGFALIPWWIRTDDLHGFALMTFMDLGRNRLFLDILMMNKCLNQLKSIFWKHTDEELTFVNMHLWTARKIKDGSGPNSICVNLHSWTARKVWDGFGPKSTFVNMHLWSIR